MIHKESYTSETIQPVPSHELAEIARNYPDSPEPKLVVAIKELLKEGEAENTVRSYQGALRYWHQWHQLRLGAPPILPWTAQTVLQFVADHALRSTSEGLRTEMPRSVDEALVATGAKAKVGALALATLEHRISVLARAHRQSGHLSPTQDPDVRELLRSVRRIYAKRGAPSNKKPALLKEPMEAILTTCDDSLIGVRDRALLLFAWSSGGRRRSEVAGARFENLRKVGPDAYLYTLGASKTNQEGLDYAGNEKPIMGRAAKALERWILRSQLSEGPIFRSIRRGGHVTAAQLSPSAVRDIVIARSAQAGLTEDYSAHSLRSGFVSEAARQHMPLPEAMAMTGHRSVASFNRYFRGDARDMKTAFLLEDAENQIIDTK